MSWIFGIGDPSGVDEDRVLTIAGTVLVGRRPVLECSVRGDVVVGTYEDEGWSPGLVRDGNHLIVADARVDAVGDADATSVEGEAAAGLIWEHIRRRGIMGLDHIAADFSLACVDEERERVLVTRDATGNRPLYWTSDGDRWAFASSPRFLIPFSKHAGELDTEVCAMFLAGLEYRPDETGIRGIHRVPGGRWLVIPHHGAATEGRWFRPEWDPVDSAINGESTGRVRDAIRTSVRDRARAGRVGVWLSGGRDSGSIAVALAREGISANCYTVTFDKAVCPSEDSEAKALAVSLGHRWFGMRQSTEIRDADLRWHLARSPFPLAMPYSTSFRSSLDQVVRQRTRVSMEGFGGELFVAPPLATADLLRSLRFKEAVRSARAFQNNWVYGYRAQIKGGLRAITPRRILNARERTRRLPPWSASTARGRSSSADEPRSARDARLSFLLWEGMDWGRDTADALIFPDGVRATYPFYDRRVIRAALRLPATALTPEPEPKWVLTEALLGPWAESRVKATHVDWFRAVAREGWDTQPHAYSRNSMMAGAGIVDPDGVAPPFSLAWDIQSAALVFVEAALQMSRPS